MAIDQTLGNANDKLYAPRSVGTTVLALIALGFVALVANALGSVWLSGKSREFTGQALREQAIANKLSRIFSSAQDVETGQRGFLLTQDAAYLLPYEKARQDIPQLISELRGLTGTDPVMSGHIGAIDKLINERIAISARTIELARQGNKGESVAIVIEGAGKRAMDQFRKELGDLTAYQTSVIQASVLEVNETTERSFWINVGTIALLIVFTGLIFFLLQRFFAELVSTRKQLEHFNSELELEVRNRTGEIVRANQEIQRFAYIVSHDLRAPLVNIMGFTSELEAIGASVGSQITALKDKAPDLVLPESALAVEEDLPEAIGFIRASTGKMDRLINAILKLSREGQRVLTPEWIRMKPLVQAATDSVQHQASEAGASFVIESLPDIVTDKNAIDQIIGNLVDNAVKYSDNGRPNTIKISGREDGAYVVYDIADTGRGIDKKDQERIFELFRRAGTQDKAGEGVGLAFVRASVRRLGGTIEATSQSGVGTTFTLRFPRTLVTRSTKS